MRVSREFLHEWESIPDDYTGPIILNCSGGNVKRIEYQVMRKLDDINAIPLKPLWTMLDNAPGLTVERKR